MDMQLRKVVDVTEAQRLAATSSFIVLMDDLETRIGQIQDELLQLSDTVQNIMDRAGDENRELTDDEAAEVDRINSTSARKAADLERRKTALEQRNRLTQGQGRVTTPQGPAAGEHRNTQQRTTSGSTMDARRIEPVRTDAGKWGFRDFGDYMKAVHVSSRNAASIDPRFLAAGPTTLQQESVGGDGGFAVPPDFRTMIMSKITAETSLLGRTDQYTTASNLLVLPLDETTQWQSSGGVKAYWEGENQAPPDTKASLTPHQTRLFKLMAIVRASDEVLEDAAGMNGWITKKVPEAIDFAVNFAIVQGTGAGMPLGILQSNALITVAAEGSQVASTILAANIEKMWARIYDETNTVWLANPSIKPQLMALSHFIKNVAGTENVGGWPLYMPPGGLSAAPYATLMGRPIVYTQACEALGSLGDLILADLGQYITAVKTPGGIRQDVSIHVYFDYAVTSFRFILRIGGQPAWTKPMTDRSGNYTYSPFVALAQRA